MTDAVVNSLGCRTNSSRALLYEADKSDRIGCSARQVVNGRAAHLLRGNGEQNPGRLGREGTIAPLVVMTPQSRR